MIPSVVVFHIQQSSRAGLCQISTKDEGSRRARLPDRGHRRERQVPRGLLRGQDQDCEEAGEGQGDSERGERQPGGPRRSGQRPPQGGLDGGGEDKRRRVRRGRHQQADGRQPLHRRF